MAARERKAGRIGLALIILAAAAVAAGWILFRAAPLDTRFTGAYRLDDGRLVIVAPRDGDTLRYRFMDGTSSALRPAGGRLLRRGHDT